MKGTAGPFNATDTDNICQFTFCFGTVIVLWKETNVSPDGPEAHLDGQVDGWMDGWIEQC